MTTRLGIGVSSDAVRGVLVRDGRVVWHREQSLESSEQLSQGLSALFTEPPWPRFSRPRALVAIGMGKSQVKALAGLPPIDESQAIGALLRPNVSRFFVKNGVPLRISDVHRSNGSWWAAVAEEPILGIVESTCRRLGIKLEGCVPTAIALSRSFGDGTIEWRDGAAVMRVALAGHAVSRVARSDTRIDGAPATISARLSAIGEDAARFADAYGAALCTRRTPLVLPPTEPREVRQVRRTTLAILIGLILLFGSAVILAPGLAAERTRQVANRRLQALQAAAAEVDRQDAALRRVSVELDQIARFAAERRSVVSFLGRVAQILPESTALLSFRADSLGGNLVVLTTSGTELLPEIGRLDGLESADLVGNVSSQSFGTARLQRMMVRYRFTGRRSEGAKAHR